ncbi:MAG: hypothetical protein AABW72_05830 [archaeon]
MRKHKNTGNESTDFWAEGFFAQTISAKDLKEKVKTIDEKHSKELKFNCRKCNAKISAHNKDWHDGMCDGCFNKKYFS